MKKDRSYRKTTIPDNATCVFEGVIFDVYQWEQVLYDGSTTTFERAVGDDITKVVPILEDGRILVITDEQPAREPMIKLPGGYVDAGETPLVAAERELLEETGYRAKSLTPYYDLAHWNKVDLRRYYFIAKGCVKVSEPLMQAGEKTSPAFHTFDSFIETTSRGELDDMFFRQRALEARLDPQKMKELKKAFFG